MGEEAAIARVEEPVTTSLIAEDLREAGVAAGDTLLVHASMSSLGWVSGGAPAVVDALRRVLTPEGTLVMPTHTPHYADPARWSDPPVPDDWVERIHETLPPFRPAVTPTRGMGAVPECFRGYPDVVRSDHPAVSFAAWGSEAAAIVENHSLDCGLGEGSPLARVYERDGDVLLLGVGHGRNTSLHLAEYRSDYPAGTRTVRAPVVEDGERTLVEYEDIETRTDDFPALGAAFERSVGLQTARVGAARARLARQPDLVDFAVDWMAANR